MLGVNFSIGGLLFLDAKIKDLVQVWTLPGLFEDWRCYLNIVKKVEQVGLTTCERVCNGRWATVLISCDRPAGMYARRSWDCGGASGCSPWWRDRCAHGRKRSAKWILVQHHGWHMEMRQAIYGRGTNPNLGANMKIELKSNHRSKIWAVLLPVPFITVPPAWRRWSHPKCPPNFLTNSRSLTICFWNCASFWSSVLMLW